MRRFEPAAGRDPIAILDKQEADRVQHLLPLRHARMAESAFAYYRGTPAVMAFDLAGTPRSDIFVQASGDAHLSNFGLFASPERRLVFDANDFDETMPGPWEWDVKRLATSFVIAGQANGFSQPMHPQGGDGGRAELSRVDGPLRPHVAGGRLVRGHHGRRHPGPGAAAAGRQGPIRCGTPGRPGCRLHEVRVGRTGRAPSGR